MRSAAVVLGVLLCLPACKTETKPKASTAELAAFLKSYSGSWRGEGMDLAIDPLGTIRYERKGSGATSKSFTAPLENVDASSFTVGVLGIRTTFRIDRPPHDEGGVRKMTIDGVELTRVASTGARAAGIAVCTRLDGDLCADPTTELVASVEKVQVSALVARAPGVGPKLDVAWIAEDVGTAAPANHVIGVTPLEVKGDPSELTGFTVKASLSRPTNGWPLGKYRVEVRSAGKAVQTARFQIVAPKS